MLLLVCTTFRATATLVAEPGKSKACKSVALSIVLLQSSTPALSCFKPQVAGHPEFSTTFEMSELHVSFVARLSEMALIWSNAGAVETV